MATQMYEVQWNDAVPEKPILTKQEIINYCRHFGQATPDLDEFLTRFDFDEWKCMQLAFDYVYGKHSDEKGGVGSDAVTYLGLIATTFLSDEGEAKLHEYVGKERFMYPEDDRTSFQVFDDCPLWMIQVVEKEKQYADCLFFMPAVFWKDAQMRDDSYGYEKYTVGDNRTYHQWYGESTNNYRPIRYWRKRIGSYSPNFIEREGTAIEFGMAIPVFDKWQNRIVYYEGNKCDVMYFYDLDNPEIKHEAKGYLTEWYNSYFMITPEEYHFGQKGSLVITDKQFNKISKTKTNVYNTFENDFWRVFLDTKGIVMIRKDTNEERRFKYSEVKMTNDIKRNNPTSLSIWALDDNTVIFQKGGTIISIDTDFIINITVLDKVFKKEIPAYFYNCSVWEVSLQLSENRRLLFTDEGVFKIGTDGKVEYFNPKLTEITGEAIFYNGIYDEALGGIWFVTSNDRLVFTDENFEKGYVFNYTEQFSNTHRSDYYYSQLYFDKEQNLWTSHYRDKLYKINRKELDNKLKTAVAYSKNQLQTF
ncbi:hypothetical protein [Flavobacterium cerinum]|uniref:WG repeat-containing protein n=1 Tax=Flavobacterium cerinum TaxID=2502784 RepID=A0ABY5IPC3_9FLAO|nr:hypothetical protein [Flavobacterium cerinum]UUC44090.1 hypothetical protein NOX80_10645 [Flavobacterium cerinum]